MQLSNPVQQKNNNQAVMPAIGFLSGAMGEQNLVRHYLEPFGIPRDAAHMLQCPPIVAGQKLSNQALRDYFENYLVPEVENLSLTYLVVTQAECFKHLTGAKKLVASVGYVMDSLWGPWKVLYAPGPGSMFHAPETTRVQITQTMTSLLDHAQGSYIEPGQGIIHSAAYPQTLEEIEQWLRYLHGLDCPLTVDIETFSLKHYKAGIATITFCWDQHNGISFPVDYIEDGIRGEPNKQVRWLLREFFDAHEGKLIWHRMSFDATVLISQLYMDNLLDTEGLLRGLEVFTRNFDDTLLITYLATNTCAGNTLGLKDLAQAFAGDYAEDDIKDVTKILVNDLLQYNLVDGLSTWFVYDRYYPQMVRDQQKDLYETIFKPALKDIIQMQLTGLPVNMARVHAVQAQLEAEQVRINQAIHGSPLVKEFTYALNEAWVEKRNSKLKKKRVTLADANEVFNPNSNPQLQKLLFDQLNLPVLDTTDSGAASTDRGTLENLQAHVKDPEEKALLAALLDHSSVAKLLTGFIPALLDAAPGPDGWHYLFGNFNLGGTISGRLSSSDPNLQNLPSGRTQFGNLIKSCFEAPPGWIFCGVDFASLEDRIGALTTKDPNKLKIYIDGFDGHSLRAVSYWPHEFPNIDINNPTSVNQLKVDEHARRQDSKGPTFALQYQGTFHTLMKQFDFSEAEAKSIEANYHKLYAVSDAWVADQLNQAAKCGYITAAFGLRVRTPLLAQVVRHVRKTPQEAKAEERSAGNALGQSWGLLNNRACSEFMGKVRKNPDMRLAIRPCAHIHDAQYYLMRDNIQVAEYLNTHLIKAVQWQNHPAIAHPTVGLGGELAIYWPTWEDGMKVPNGAKGEAIRDLVTEHVHKIRELEEKEQEKQQETK